MKIWTDDKYLEINPTKANDLVAAMYFKAENIEAKADPELFKIVGDVIAALYFKSAKEEKSVTNSTEKTGNNVTNLNDVVQPVRCKDCKNHKEICTAIYYYGSKRIEHKCVLHGIYLAQLDFFCKDGERKK